MQEKLNNWQRIESVIKWANMSTNYFARHIGLPRGENLYQIKRGNNGISLNVAERIVARFPDVDKLWLLTGEGQMLSEERSRGALIPYYPVDVEQGITCREHLTPQGELIVPQAGACDLAMQYNGQAMGSCMPAGAIVLLKAVDKESIIPGGEYVIVSQKIVTLRIVRAAEQSGQLRLVAGDRDKFDDMLLNVSDIISVYKVKGKLIINN